ncbi:MAG: DUF3572 domain-containing protein [Sphingomonadales bacterium]
MNHDHAETIALQAIAHIIGDEWLQKSFLAQSGMDEGLLRERLKDIELHCAALDFLMQRDDWLTVFAESLDLPPEQITRARQALAPLDIYG